MASVTDDVSISIQDYMFPNKGKDLDLENTWGHRHHERRRELCHESSSP